MGAFILYDKRRKSELDQTAVRDVFARKGFADPLVFSLDQYELHLYRKQLVNTDNYYVNGENAVYMIGTAIYKGLGYQDTIRQLLEDYINDSVEYDRILGSYCAVFFVNRQIGILNDALNVCQLFSDTEERFITSSFLAAANAVQTLTVDRDASLEKLLTGYIVGEQTLFRETKRVVPALWQGKIQIHRWTPVDVPQKEKNRRAGIQGRVEKIAAYMKDIEKLAAEYKPELGLSGGYDSRLIFAAAQEVWPFSLDLHTHSTEEVQIHRVEKEIVN